mmetsp:Transcript_7643/g.15972  ORF Transcript_7643/g.15972 Transcript_7643/m.15972 type:complete len:623 (+) Transcript_7643:55-1923(+)
MMHSLPDISRAAPTTAAAAALARRRGGEPALRIAGRLGRGPAGGLSLAVATGPQPAASRAMARGAAVVVDTASAALVSLGGRLVLCLGALAAKRVAKRAARASLVAARGIASSPEAAPPLHVIIAGGGLGGLLAANALSRKGAKVTVLEKTNTFKKFGGPIQLAPNALAALYAVDTALFERVMEDFVVIGTRTCGMKDGLRTEWYTKLTTIRTVSEEYDLPYSGVVSRDCLQSALLEALKDTDVDIQYDSRVVGYKHMPDNGVQAICENGEQFEGDVLVGADGIWSRIRAQMWEEEVEGPDSGITYSGYTCFAGNCLLPAEDYFEVGYKVYIGPRRFFVTCDIGRGRTQWYAFICRDPGTAKPDDMVSFLKEEFKDWSLEVHALLDATRSTGKVEARDLYDRPPSLTRSWSEGCVTMLGDAVHPMMPNLGQGGCQALEDGFVLADLLGSVQERAEIPEVLQRFYHKRLWRTAAVQGISRTASNMLNGTFSFPWRPMEWMERIRERGFGTEAPAGLLSWWEKGVRDLTDARRQRMVATLLDYKGFFTACFQPLMPVIFGMQFEFLYQWGSTLVGPDGDKLFAHANKRGLDMERHRREALAAWEKLPAREAANAASELALEETS